MRAGRLLLYDTLTEVWRATLAEQTISLAQKADLQLAMAHAVGSAVEAVELMYRIAGTSGIYTRSPLERHFRDVQVLRHHAFGAEGRYETGDKSFSVSLPISWRSRYDQRGRIVAANTS